MAKSFKKTNPLDNIDNQAPVSTMAAGQLPEEPKTKRRAGRPRVRKEDAKTVNIAIPVSTLDKINDVKICFGNNLTLYINKLIEKDLESNYDDYKRMADSLNAFKE